MTFSHNKTDRAPIRIGNIVLPEATEFKFLGTWIDNSLNWKHHLNQLLLKLNKNLHMLRMGKKFLSRDVLLTLYYAHIYSHLSYGIILWGNMASQRLLQKLQSIQNKCVSCILNKRAAIADFTRLRMLRIKDIIWLNNAKMGYKLKHSQLPSCVADLCASDSNNKSTC